IAPSTRLATLTTQATVAAQRRLEPRSLRRLLCRELDWIVLKALAKEREGRYESAAALAEDVRRFLADRPVRARPTRSRERFWRWCRRNPLVAGLIASVSLLVLALAIGSTIAAYWLEKEKEATSDQLTLKIAAEGTAQRRLFESLLAQTKARRLTGQ